MGVLNKLKGRMSGPAQTDMSSPVYGFDTGKKPSSGVDAVNAGLAAGYSQAQVAPSNVGQQIAEAGANIGSALGSMGDSKRSESISKSKEAGKTGREARAQWKKEKEEKAYFKKHGKRKPKEIVSLESEDIAPILRSMPGATYLEKDKPEGKKFGARFGNAPIIDEGLI